MASGGTSGAAGSSVAALLSRGGGAGVTGLSSGSDLAIFYQMHEGGIVGEGGQARASEFSDWSKAVRYHTGGIAGRKPDPRLPPELKPGEEPVVLQAGEEILRAADPRHRDNQRADAAEQSLRLISTVVQALPAPVAGLARDEVPAILKRGDEVITADDPRHVNAARGLQGIADLVAAAGPAGAISATGASSLQAREGAQATDKLLERIAAPDARPGKTAAEVVANMSDAILPRGIEARPQRVLAALQANERRAVLRAGEEVIPEDDPRHRDNMGMAWLEATKYHTGGIVGDAPDASPIASTADAAMRGAARTGDTYQRAGDTHVHVSVAPPPGANRQTMQQWGTDAGRQIERAMRRSG
jgi:hypothetical protein